MSLLSNQIKYYTQIIKRKECSKGLLSSKMQFMSYKNAHFMSGGHVHGLIIMTCGARALKFISSQI